MVKGVGIDLVDVNQLKELDERTKGAFFRRTFTTEEQRQAEMCPDKYEYLAARFAAKEAVFKAVNGLLPVGSLDFRTIETLNEANGKPYVHIDGKMKELWQPAGVEELLISITTEGNYASAFVIAQG